MRVSSPTAAKTVTGVQSPLPHRRRIFPSRNKEVPTPTATRPAAFGAVPATRQVLVPYAEDDGPDPQRRVDAHALSKRSRHACPVHPPYEEGGALEAHGVTRTSLSRRARHALSGSPSVRREGLAPSRPFRDTGS